MEALELENRLNSNKIDSLYLLYGEEKYLLENSLNKIIKIFGEKINGINYIELDSTNVENIIENIETPAFGYNKKMIIIKNSQLFKKQLKSKKEETTNKNTEIKKGNSITVKLANFITDNILMINQSTILIFIEEEIDKNELYKAIENNGNVCEFVKLKHNDIQNRLKSICNAYKVNIDGSTLQYLIENCGTDMQVLINEIRKQIEYAGKNGIITNKSIDLLAIKQLDSIIFDLTDNLGKKNTKQALTILNNMIYNREPIQKILITLYNHFKKLYITKISIRSNLNIAESLKLKPNQMFLTSKYTMQSKYFKEDEIRKILQEFIDLDYQYKIGNIDANIGLESILCKYCS